jgi:hypothetical protein
LDEPKLKKGSAMALPYVTTVSFADRDGVTVCLQYGVAAPNEKEARSELQRRLINQEIYNYSISEIRPATSTEAQVLNLSAGSIILLN